MLVYVLGISGDGTSYLRGIGYYGVPDVGGTDLGQSGSHSVGLGTEVCRTGDVEERGAALVGYLAEFRTHLAFDGIHPPNEFLRTFVGIGEESDHECTVGVSSVLPTGKTEYGLTGIGRGSGIHVGQVVLLAPGVYGIRIRFRDAFEVRGFPVTYGRERGERLVHVLAVNIVFALANPVPETSYDAAKEAGVTVAGTGRSDRPNQVNNVSVFPGVFRGAIDVRARAITEEMKVAAVYAIADLIDEKDLREDYVVPDAFDPRVAPAVAAAVAKVAIEKGLARKIVDPEVVRANTAKRIGR